MLSVEFLPHSPINLIQIKCNEKSFISISFTSFFNIYIEFFPRNKWLYINGRYYYFSRKPGRNWYHARRCCRENGGDLAVLSNSEINNKIYQVIKQLGIPTVWIGVYRNGSKNFMTVNGVNPLYTNWYPDEPNNSYGKEHCVELVNVAVWVKGYPAAGRWNDAPCSETDHYFVCERSFLKTRLKGQLLTAT